MTRYWTLAPDGLRCLDLLQENGRALPHPRWGLQFTLLSSEMTKFGLWTRHWMYNEWKKWGEFSYFHGPQDGMWLPPIWIQITKLKYAGLGLTAIFPFYFRFSVKLLAITFIKSLLRIPEVKLTLASFKRFLQIYKNINMIYDICSIFLLRRIIPPSPAITIIPLKAPGVEEGRGFTVSGSLGRNTQNSRPDSGSFLGAPGTELDNEDWAPPTTGTIDRQRV